MSIPLFQAAVRLYCENPAHVVDSCMADVLASEQAISRDDAERALHEVRELVEFCVREIYRCYSERLGTQEPARIALQTKRPDLGSELLSTIYRYSSFCIAKG